MYKAKDLKLFVDISTYCNAGCPQCHRTDPDGLGKAEWLPLIQWNIEEFKTAFPPQVLKVTKTLNLCGTWGDPIMNRDIDKIIEYVVSVSDCAIVIDTNGSIRDEQWWWEFGAKGGKQLSVVFAVDGMNQQQHEKYRRFTDLQKVLNNMQSLSETHATAQTNTILFAHNQDHIEEIQNLCIKYGAKAHRITQSDRFENKFSVDGQYFNFVNEKGQQEQLAITTYDPPNGHIAHTEQKTLDKQIQCRWKMANRLVVNVDGQVYPCCYIVNPFYKSTFDHTSSRIQDHPVMQEYTQHKKENNVFHKSLLDIITQNKWFNHTLPNSWQSDNPIKQCSKYCSTMIKTKHALEAYL